MDVQLVMLFVRGKQFPWWKMKKGLNTRRLMKINAFVAINVLVFAQ